MAEDNIKIELNKAYSGPQIANILGISKNTYSRKRSEYLDYLKNYYEIQQKGYKVILKRELKPLQSRKEVLKQNRKQDKQMKTQAYREKVHGIIEEKPLNSGMNLARQIVYDEMLPQYSHAVETAATYTRGILKEDYDEVGKRVWSRIDLSTNTYEPITNEQREYLYSLFGNVKFSTVMMELAAKLDAGDISVKEFKELAGDMVMSRYNKVLSEFKQKYGFRPYKAANWQMKEDKNWLYMKDNQKISLLQVKDEEFNF